jgi:MFS family permease/GNAT superfamily N-acetyltransferase
MRGLGPSFWRLFISSATSDLADGVGRVALPLLAATLTRDPLLISALTAFAFLPWLLFALVSGALVDRIDRRRAMVAANLLRAMVIGGLAAAALLGVANMALVYAVAFTIGVAETIYDSAARAALPQLVRLDQLEAGNSLIATGQVVGQTFLGAPIGSFLFAAVAAAPLFTNAVGFALAAALVLTIRQSLRPVRTDRTSIRSDIRDGLRWIWNHHFLRGLTLLTAGTGIGLYMTIAVQVLYVLQTLHLSEAAYGLIMVAAGGGAVLGGLTAPLISARLGRPTSLIGAVALNAIATMALGLTSEPLLASALFALAALAGTVWDVLSLSLRQALIPTEMFGRAQGSYRTAVWGAFPLGALAGGALAAATSVPAVFLIAGLANLLIAAGLWLLIRTHSDEVTTTRLQQQPTAAHLHDSEHLTAMDDPAGTQPAGSGRMRPETDRMKEKPLERVTIRRASLQDAERLTALCHASRAYQGVYAEAIAQVQVTPGYIAQHLVFVAADREAHPLAFYSLIRDPPEIDMMFVADEVQGLGIGRLLIDHMSEQARAIGLTGVRVVSHPSAEGFYRRAGAQRIGTVPANPPKTTWERPELWFKIT